MTPTPDAADLICATVAVVHTQIARLLSTYALVMLIPVVYYVFRGRNLADSQEHLRDHRR